MTTGPLRALTILATLAAGIMALPAWQQAAAQSADPDIFLVSIENASGRIRVTGARNLTDRPGYDNQPSWALDGSAIYFTSVREDAQADIYRIPSAGGPATRVTTTAPESEYSATLIPGRNAISVIRVERDSAQRLWSVPLDGSQGTVILERIKPVGYHTWVGASTLALFVLGSPPTLQLASTGTGNADVIAAGIGRSLHTTREGQVSFVHKVSDDEWWLTLLDPSTREMKRLVQMPRRVEDVAWTPDGRVLAAEGSVLKVFDPRSGGGWLTVGDLSEHGMAGVTRLAVSPKGDAVAVVAVPSRR